MKPQIGAHQPHMWGREHTARGPPAGAAQPARPCLPLGPSSSRIAHETNSDAAASDRLGADVGIGHAQELLEDAHGLAFSLSHVGGIPSDSARSRASSRRSDPRPPRRRPGSAARRTRSPRSRHHPLHALATTRRARRTWTHPMRVSHLGGKPGILDKVDEVAGRGFGPRDTDGSADQLPIRGELHAWCGDARLRGRPGRGA